jgi:predicted nucleic acid-binding Zn ribbon protein
MISMNEECCGKPDEVLPLSVRAKRKCKACGKLFVPDNDFQGFCSERCYRIFKGEIKASA